MRELIFVVFRRGQGVCIFQWLFQKSFRGGIRIVRHVQSNIITKNWNNSLVKKIIKEKRPPPTWIGWYMWNYTNESVADIIIVNKYGWMCRMLVESSENVNGLGWTKKKRGSSFFLIFGTWRQKKANWLKNVKPGSKQKKGHWKTHWSKAQTAGLLITLALSIVYPLFCLSLR